MNPSQEEEAARLLLIKKLDREQREAENKAIAEQCKRYKENRAMRAGWLREPESSKRRKRRKR